MLNGHRNRGIPFKWKPSGDHFIEHHTGGVQIGACVNKATPGLLRRDIVDRAQRLLGQSAVAPGGHPRDAEVGHLYAPVPEHHHIVGLDVPMDNAPAVVVAQRLGNL